MHIYPKNSGPVRPETNKVSQTNDQVDRSIKPVAPAPSSADRSDKVQISDAGRALSARTDDTQSASRADTSRTSQIRGRILSGAYDTLEVVDTVAKRILDSGDL